MKEVDAERGFVRGVPAVMGGFFGKDLGVIKLALIRQSGRWVVDTADTHSEVRPICQQDGQGPGAGLRGAGSADRPAGGQGARRPRSPTSTRRSATPACA